MTTAMTMQDIMEISGISQKISYNLFNDFNRLKINFILLHYSFDGILDV